MKFLREIQRFLEHQIFLKNLFKIFLCTVIYEIFELSILKILRVKFVQSLQKIFRIFSLNYEKDFQKV